MKVPLRPLMAVCVCEMKPTCETSSKHFPVVLS
uniref:Uncharacterized protein n=1 Tax=Parascaris equorum TaxID=6256 RepID=A0A914S775_PAREQ